VPDGNARAPAPGSAQAAKNPAHAMIFPKTKLSQAVEINVSADGGLTIGIDKTGPPVVSQCDRWLDGPPLTAWHHWPSSV